MNEDSLCDGSFRKVLLMLLMTFNGSAERVHQNQKVEFMLRTHLHRFSIILTTHVRMCRIQIWATQDHLAHFANVGVSWSKGVDQGALVFKAEMNRTGGRCLASVHCR